MSRECPGVALRCAEDGHIEAILCSRLTGIREATPGLRFDDWVHPPSAPDARQFLDVLTRRRAAFDWALEVIVDGAPRALSFAGTCIEHGMLILGAQTRADLAQLSEELMHINNEQSNALRTALKSLSLQRRDRNERDTALMEELSRVNNDLATAQRELARKNVELARLNQQKNEFLGIAAHDLRNPLDVIASYGRFLLEDLDGRVESHHRDFLRRIQSSSEFMRNLVDSHLDFARIESGTLALDMAPCDISALVERNVSLNQVLAAKKNTRIDLDHAGAPAVRVDAPRIDQALNNLIGNAIKFSPPGSTIAVRVRPLGAHGATIAVSDQGPGIREEDLERLFEPFGQATARGTAGEKGAGLGLAIARRIIDAHGGCIAVTSSSASGSVFSIDLPGAPPSSVHDAARGA